MSGLSTKPVDGRSTHTGWGGCPVPVIGEVRRGTLRFPCQDPDYPPQCPFAVPVSAFGRAAHERLTEREERELFGELQQIRERLAEPPTALSGDVGDRRERLQITCRACSIRRFLGQAYFKLAISVARGFAKSYQEIDDLVGQACVTLMRALDLFDVRRGNRFSTYATRAIRTELRRYVLRRRRERSRPVDPTRLNRHRAILGPGSHPGTAAYCALEKLIDRLEPREVDVVRARFGLHDQPGCETLQSVADRLGVTRERVRQVEQRALAKLRCLAIQVPPEALEELGK